MAILSRALDGFLGASLEGKIVRLKRVRWGRRGCFVFVQEKILKLSTDFGDKLQDFIQVHTRKYAREIRRESARD